MDISIKITSKKTALCEGRTCLKGRIKIGDFKEPICLHLGQWNKEDYEKQWREGLGRLKTYDTSCLIDTVNDPKASAVVGWWTLYRVGDAVFIQNGSLPKAIYKKLVGNAAFTPETCYNFVTPRVTDRQVSEWSVPWTE